MIIFATYEKAAYLDDYPPGTVLIWQNSSGGWAFIENHTFAFFPTNWFVA